MPAQSEQPEQSRSVSSRSGLDEAYDTWSHAAAAVLAKSRRVEVDELPDTPEALLSTRTRDGLAIRPLYTRRDETAEPGVPGQFPYVRGADPARDVLTGWRVTERFGDTALGDDPTAPADTNSAVLDAMTNGTSGLWLTLGGALTVDDIPTVLSGVYLDLVPITLDAGAAGIEAARALLGVRDAATPATSTAPPTAATTLSLGLSPLTAAYSGRATVAADAATALAVDVAAEYGRAVRTFRVDGTDFATAGADNGLELGLSVAAALAHVRDLAQAGLAPAQALEQISFAVSIDDDQFAGIAKLRALRRIWARVADVVGAPEVGAALTHAVTDLSMYSQRDPWVNMLRSTIAAFGAGVGGADQVTVLGFDAALPADARTSGARFSRRMARNTQLVLLEESNIGRVLDPAGGSWFVESLTDDLAANAWAVFGDLERRGGYHSALESGWIADRVAESLATRDIEVAHRRQSVTGVNEFPNLDEKPIATPAASMTGLPGASPRLARVGRAFESLRDRSDTHLAATGTRPRILLLPLGSVAEHNGRTTFVTNLLAAGGIEAVNPGPMDATGVADAAAAAATPIAVLCGTRQRYADEGPTALAAVRAAGLTRVLLAGPAKEWPAGDDGPDAELRVGIDAVTALTDLFDRLVPTEPATSGVQA
ncbi:methylmalonyl-CoA mutase family protein [Gordonia sp. DT30]|uniref:methylmalonyl-CoA mutase family protein n=1 Tax=Gordonia sp. DT30 TaxID=3416546 RepID=UPI003CEE085C